jgi:hypothetical protein
VTIRGRCEKNFRVFHAPENKTSIHLPGAIPDMGCIVSGSPAKKGRREDNNLGAPLAGAGRERRALFR